jgi:hypothetical protein
VTRTYTAIAIGLVLLAGCAENDGMTRTRADARTYTDAHANCWEVSMNNAGHAQTGAQTRAYDSCMGRHGWADLRGTTWLTGRSYSGAPE